VCWFYFVLWLDAHSANAMRAPSCALVISLAVWLCLLISSHSAYSELQQSDSQSDHPSDAASSTAVAVIAPGINTAAEACPQPIQRASADQIHDKITPRPLEAGRLDVAKRDAVRRTMQGTLPPAVGPGTSNDDDYNDYQYYSDALVARTDRVSHGGSKIASDFVSKAAAQAAEVGHTYKPSAVRAHHNAADTVSEYQTKTRVHTSETSRDHDDDRDITRTVNKMHTHMAALSHEDRSNGVKAVEQAAVAAVNREVQQLTTVEPTVIGTEIRETAMHETAQHEAEQQLLAVQAAAAAAAAAAQQAAQQSMQAVEADLATDSVTADSVTAAAVRTIVYSGIALAVPVVATVALSTGTVAATAATAALSTSTASTTATATAATAGVMLLHQLQFATLTGLIKADQSQDVSTLYR
jgi:trimeric autotransporter adhesin